MKRKKVFTLILVVTLITSLLLVGCGDSKKGTADNGNASNTIKIAVAGPMTGDYAQYGEAFQRATSLKAKEINDAGGIDGKKIELIVLDDKNDAKEATNVAQKLISDEDIVGLIGHFSSSACLAAAPVYQKAGLVEFSPTSSHPRFTKQGTYMFRNVNTQEVEGPIAAEFAINDLGKKKIAIIYINNDWGITAKDNFISKAEELGGEIVACETFIGGQTKDFTPTITKIREAEPELVFLAAMYSESGMIAQQIKQMNYDVQLLGTSALNNEQFLKLAGDSIEGLYLTNNFFAQDPKPMVQNFIKEFKDEFGVEPDQFAALAYDSLGMMAEALKVSGCDRAKLRDELAKIKNYEGVTGNTTFNENRDVIKEMVILQVKDNKFTLYK
ncbi:ABC transporter substrate-binding protein [Abyssisolibacter fermentans]|uniref:ABC transporter substrate-binding protein n=1 Tax=Abyssisolibacter fermentans TaxID=1766203 RepID=UPI0008365226|nr:ABC transporter substrate-binding protein [Abyssisolibacter fermentans]